MHGAFYGIGAAAIAIVARSVFKLTQLALAQSKRLWSLFGVSALVTAWTESEILGLFLACGVVTVLVCERRPSCAAVRGR